MSALIAPFSISSLSSPTLLPVFLLISCRGLNPALIICSRSCPESLPALETCAKASVRDSSFWASPWEISPSWPSRSFASSALMPNAIRVWVFLARSSIPNGVFAAVIFRSLTSCWALAWSPSMVVKLVVYCSIEAL